MRITKSLKNLEVGTVIYLVDGGFYQITSEYDTIRDRYHAKWYDVDEEGNETIFDADVVVSPHDLIGEEMF
ncbi:MAG: hypothetical protein ACI4JA_06625 [Oscillospiraceae bacterium]